MPMNVLSAIGSLVATAKVTFCKNAKVIGNWANNKSALVALFGAYGNVTTGSCLPFTSYASTLRTPAWATPTVVAVSVPKPK